MQRKGLENFIIRTFEQLNYPVKFIATKENKVNSAALTLYKVNLYKVSQTKTQKSAGDVFFQVQNRPFLDIRL